MNPWPYRVNDMFVPSSLHLAAPYVLAAFLTCDAQPAPVVVFNYVQKDPIFLTDHTTQELRALAPSMTSVNLADFPITSGITQGNINLETSILFQSQGQLTGGYCLWPKEVDVTLTYQAQVHIAKEYRAYSCRFIETRLHELRHVAADEEVLKQFIPGLKQAAEARAAKGTAEGPFDLEQRDAMKKLISETYETGMSRELDKLESARTLRQQAIDTPAEYTRLSRACPGEPLR